MMTVNAKRKFTAKELAEEFGVSYRTMLRDLNELSALGVPFYSEVGVGGGYRMLNDRMLPPILFTETEATAMFFAYQSLEFFGSLPFQTETRSALKKFYQYLPEDVKKRIDDMKDRIVFWNPTRPQPSEHLHVLLEASIDQTTVQIQYDSAKESSERMIQPIGLYSYNGFWYCPAYCLKRDAFRVFRTDRIHTAEQKALPGNQKVPFRSIMDWILLSEKDCPDPVSLVVELTREGIRRAKSDLDLCGVIQVREDGTGWIDTHIPKSEVRYYARIIWGLGADAIVKKPVEAIQYMKENLEELMRIYGHFD